MSPREITNTMLFLTWAKDVLTLGIVVLANAIVTVGFLVVARVTVLNGEVWLAELGCAIAVLWKVTLVATRPTLSSCRKELKREKRRKLHQKIESLQQRRTLHPKNAICPPK